MRIDDKRLNGISSNNRKSAKKADAASGEFRTMLQQRLEALRGTEGADAQPDVEQLEAWGMVEEATHMLDQLLEQVRDGNAPEADLVRALQELRGQLQAKPGSKAMQEVDALLAVESERLRGLS